MDITVNIPNEVVDAINEHVNELASGVVRGGQAPPLLPYTDLSSYIAHVLSQAFGQLLLAYPQPASAGRKQQMEQLEADNRDAATPTVRSRS